MNIDKMDRIEVRIQKSSGLVSAFFFVSKYDRPYFAAGIKGSASEVLAILYTSVDKSPLTDYRFTPSAPHHKHIMSLPIVYKTYNDGLDCSYEEKIIT